jgi:predicted dehydrogenase
VFNGFDGYKAAIDACDVAILATSPGFRPTHLAYAVGKNKHVFMEKPHATDVAGARSVLESAKAAKEKGLCLVSGFCYRYDPFKRETVKRIHGGAIGDVAAIHTTFLTGELWTRATKTNDPGELEYQMRMWYYFTWLSGDFLVEQAIHNVDKAHWMMNALPVAATGLGGRQVRTEPKFGNIWDNFSVVYEYDSGARVFLQCRQQPGRLYKKTFDHVMGTKGSAELMGHTIKSGDTTWTHPGEHDFGLMYQKEHDELFAAIRSGKPLNDGVRSAESTLMGILGREAAYTGERITWKQLMESKQSLVPKEFAWGPNPVAPVATPGKTRLA